MARLVLEDIKRIAKEVEEQEIWYLQHILEHDVVMEFEHGDWGDRDRD